MVILLDASFIVAFDNVEDLHHIKAKELWEKIKNYEFGRYIISDYIFDETIGVVMRKKNKDRAFLLGSKILKTFPIATINSDIFECAWKIFGETKLNFSFTDCTSLALLNLINSKKIATFDKAFSQIGMEVIN